MSCNAIQRISWIRYGVYCLFAFLSATGYHAWAIWPAMRIPVVLVSPWVVPDFASWIQNQLYSSENPRTPLPAYSRGLTMLTNIYAGRLTSLIQQRSDVAWMLYQVDAQIWFIHFAVVFLLLSECDFYWRYWNYVRDTPVAMTEGKSLSVIEKYRATFCGTFAFANFDTTFTESRDALGYFSFSYSEMKLAYTAPSLTRSIRASLPIISLPLFYLICAGPNYLVNIAWNPCHHFQNSLRIAAGLDVLFNSSTIPHSLLSLILLRPVRLLNNMVFWECISRLCPCSYQESRDHNTLMDQKTREQYEISPPS